MKKNKLLIVSAISPFPKNSGGAVRIYNEIKYLSEEYEVFFVFFQDQTHVLSDEEIAFLKRHTHYFRTFTLGYHENRNSFFTDSPYWFQPWKSDELELYISQLVAQENIHYCQIEFTQLLYLYRALPKTVRKIFVALDISTVSFWRRLTELRNPVTQLVHYWRWKQVDRYEKKYLPKYDLVISMSNNDTQEIKHLFEIENVIAIPNGIDTISFIKPDMSNDAINIGYIGSFNHPPNRYAFTYFVKNIAPRLDAMHIKFKYFLAGNNDQAELSRIISNHYSGFLTNFENMGIVKDSGDFFTKINVLVAPLWSGSGTRIKILEALSYGIPVVTTEIGAEGIGIQSKFLMISNKLENMIESIIAVKHHSYTSKDYAELNDHISPLTWETIFSNYSHYIK